MARNLEYIEGTVARRNDRGVVLTDNPDVWINRSQFSDTEIVLPEPGRKVRLGLDSRGFIRFLELMHQREPEEHPTDVLPAPVSEVPSRDVQIVRMACLKVAQRYWSDSDVSTDALLATAEQFEQWVLRSGNG